MAQIDYTAFGNSFPVSYYKATAHSLNPNTFQLSDGMAVAFIEIEDCDPAQIADAEWFSDEDKADADEGEQVYLVTYHATDEDGDFFAYCENLDAERPDEE